MRFHSFELHYCPRNLNLQQLKMQETACVIVAASLREPDQKTIHRTFLFDGCMLGTSDVGSESVSVDVQADAAKTRFLSPCGSDRLAAPVVIVAFGAIISQNPAGHEYTCLSPLKPTSETGTLVVRFDARSVDETFALITVFLLDRCMFTRGGC